jgi:chemotaxis protein MotB
VLTRKKISDSEQSGPIGAPGWMVTYADMMTLVLCFFVLILSFSAVEIQKFKQAMGSMRGALGSLPAKADSSTGSATAQEPTSAQAKQDLDELDKLFQNENIKDYVNWKTTPEGIRIMMNDPVLFDLGKADLKPEVFPIMKAIIKVINTQHPAEIIVQGHTDDLPIHNSQYPSNWELSAARALNVVEFFAQQGNVEPKKLSAIGYGEFRPAFPNAPGGCPKNRRVEILLKKATG